MMSRFIRTLWLLATVWNSITHCYREEPATCEEIRADMCSHLKYKKTKMPNFLGHQSQEEAILELRQWKVAETLTCSPHIKFFLCSLFMPMCTSQWDGPLVVEVCRSMCLQVKQDCEPTLAALRVEWPLNCSRLPETSSNQQLCMAPEEVQQDNAPSQISPGYPQQPNAPSHVSPNPPKRPKPSPDVPVIDKQPVDVEALSGECPLAYFKLENSTCTNICKRECRDCVPDCSYNVYYTESHKQFAYIWIAIWSALCIASTLFTITTFCIDTERFRYPARSIIFMAFCYLMYSTAYLIRMFMPAKEIACRPTDAGASVLIVDGMESTLCIVVFLIQYYFGMASHLWWAVLTLTWYLAASRKWVPEAINSIACYFHLIAWAVPAILTIGILVTGKVDADELTGMCYVGNHDEQSLLYFVIVPLALLFLVGDIFILAGFCSLFRTRTSLKSKVNNTNMRKLEKLMAKVGVFSILYSVPAVCVLGAYFHQYINMNTWRCMSKSDNSLLEQSIPTVEIHMLKTFMSLAIGITISMWVLSAKTWQTCEKKVCSRSRRKDAPHLANYERSHVVSSSTDRNAFMQHYSFPVRQGTLGSHQQHYEYTEAKL